MARYFLRYRHSDTGLTPTFSFFKKASDLSVVTPPAVGEVGAGTYYFDYSPTFDIVFEVDGGVSIPTEEVRYISDTISPKDTYVDEPTSQVKDDVWNDAVDRAGGTKGDYVEKLVGMETSLADIKGAGFNTATDSLKIISDNVDAIGVTTSGLPSAATVASAVWDKPTSSHVLAGSFGQASQTEGSGVCTGGAASTITLAVGSSAVDDFYNSGLVVLTSGPGNKQARTITGYVGLTRVATVDRPWSTGGIPVAASTEYVILPAAPVGSVSPTAVADAVWDTVLALHLTAGSTGAKLNTAGGLTGPQTAAAVWDALTASYTAINSFGARAATDSDNIKRSLGMLHENSVLDQTTFTVDNNLLTGRMRIYDSKANADAATAASPGVYNTGKIAEYAIVATYTGINLKTYKVSLEP